MGDAAGRRNDQAIAGPDRLFLWTPVALKGEDLHTTGAFTVSAGERVPFVLTYTPSHDPRPVLPRRGRRSAQHGGLLARFFVSRSGGRTLERRGQALAHHAEGAHLHADGRDRGRRDDLPAREARRDPQLGLPFLLAARRHHDADGL